MGSTAEAIEQTQELLSAIAASIQDYQEIKLEVSTFDELIATLFAPLALENQTGPAFDAPDRWQAVLKVAVNAETVVRTTDSLQAESQPISVISTQEILKKPFDAFYDAAWHNARTFGSVAKVEKARDHELMLELFRERMMLRLGRQQRRIPGNGGNAGFLGAPSVNAISGADAPPLGLPVSKYYEIVARGNNGGEELRAITTDLELKNFAGAIMARQSFTFLLSLIDFAEVTVSGGEKVSDLIGYASKTANLITEGYFSYKLLQLYTSSNGLETNLGAGTMQAGGKALAAVSALRAATSIARLVENLDADGLKIAAISSQVTADLAYAARGLSFLGKASNVITPGFALQQAGISTIGTVANVLSGSLNIADAARSHGASAGDIAAASSELVWQLLSSYGVASATAPAGMLLWTAASMFQPTAISNAVKLAEMRDAAWKTYAETKWSGDWAIGKYYDNQHTQAVISAIPIANLFSGFLQFAFNGDALGHTILKDYLGRAGADGTVESAVQDFWNDGFDTREKQAQQGYIDSMKALAASTEVKRVVAVTGQELRADMAQVAGITGGKIAQGVKSGVNYMYVEDGSSAKPSKNGLYGQSLVSDIIDINSGASSQYFTMLTPLMRVTDESRASAVAGKNTRYGSSLPRAGDKAMEIVDGASHTTADVRNFASFELAANTRTRGSDSGLSLKMGAGDDMVILGLRAAGVDGQDGFDGVDYRFALSQSHADSHALKVVATRNPSTPYGYEATKTGLGTVHNVVEKTETFSQGKETRTIVSRTIVTVKDFYTQGQTDTLSSIEWIYGSNLNDQMMGGDWDDSFFGNSGDDELRGHKGNDRLTGGAGDDILDGGDGSDLLIGGEGDDYIIGLNSTDAISPAAVAGDTLIGGEGKDTIKAGGANDLIFGDDASTGENDATQPAEKAGVNYSDTIDGGAGDDIIDGGFGNDRIEGDDGNDQIFGGSGNDTLMGEAGNDTIWGGSGNDSITGGSGEDALYGQDGDDCIEAGADNSVLAGGAGRDLLKGGLGNDILIGGEGSDVMRGGEGNDIIFDDARSRNAQNEFYGEGGNDILVAGDATLFDLFDGGAGNDILSLRFISKGVDVNIDRKSVDWLGGTTPTNDTLRSIEWLEGSEHNDSLTGNAQDNRLIGRGGDDTLNGGSGKDVLFGGAGRDEIYGGLGADIIDGGAGNDQIYGRGGDSMFFDGEFGHDVVQAEDGADLSGSLFVFTGVDYRNLFFTRHLDSLLIRREQVITGVDKSEYLGIAGVMIVDYFTGNNSSKVAFADQNGSALVGMQVNMLIDAMSSGLDTGVGTSGFASFMAPIWANAWAVTSTA
ncbi:hypothetical protein FPY71_04265 [Aureimonas fodinaquatilis]|uniref:RTX pore-forming domain-containing protein n=1 Tax=Aureimonas fodinaquatilis TaxID=2565783 RepID=A0A5B0E4H1_9HYPH|nr:hypothetical protein [Aureimonas fodinaquatilis]KAA0972319.1 hypothetical protein FPY71_04265 [Aureimonas fodinaquatilis]